MRAWTARVRSPAETWPGLRKKTFWKSKPFAILFWLVAFILLFVVVGLILYATAGRSSSCLFWGPDFDIEP